MDWLGSGDIRLRIGVTGDEGSPIGVRKMREMCKNGKNWENGQKWAKNNEKKMKNFSKSYLQLMQLYFTHQLIPKNDEPRPWGGPLECTYVKNAN